MLVNPEHERQAKEQAGRAHYLRCKAERAEVEQRFDRVEVAAGESIGILLVFDIMTTGFKRQLSMRFREGPLVPVVVSALKER